MYASETSGELKGGGEASSLHLGSEVNENEVSGLGRIIWTNGP